MNNPDPTPVQSHVVTTAIASRYRLVSAGHPKPTWLVWARLHHNIRDLAPQCGENVVSTK